MWKLKSGLCLLFKRFDVTSHERMTHVILNGLKFLRPGAVNGPPLLMDSVKNGKHGSRSLADRESRIGLTSSRDLGVSGSRGLWSGCWVETQEFFGCVNGFRGKAA